MDYSSLIQRAWSLTWHHRFLWFLALFAGSSGGTCAGGGPPSGGGAGGGSGDFDLDRMRRQLEPGAQRSIEDLTRWLSQNLGIILAVAFGLAVLLIPLGIAGAILFATDGVNPASVGFAVLAGFVAFLALLTFGAAANAFLWNYWSLVYLHLTRRLGPKMLPLAVEQRVGAPA